MPISYLMLDLFSVSDYAIAQAGIHLSFTPDVMVSTQGRP
jgi:hypothetical protein